MTDQHQKTAALVIGGTQGLGPAIARRLKDEGCQSLIVAARDPVKGAAAAAELGCDFLPVDLADTASVRHLVDEAQSRLGRITALVNAGAATDRASILDCTPELFDRMFAVNVRAPFFLMQEAAKIMRREKIEGAMVNILSMSAHGGQPFISAYCGSKGALATLTKNAAFSLMPWRIRVNGLNIGWMSTPGEDRKLKFSGIASNARRAASNRRERTRRASSNSRGSAPWNE